MLRGLTTVTYFASDVDAAATWYAQVLDIEPYFRREADGRAAYVEFRIGDYQHELGLLDSRFAPGERGSARGGPVTYWHVDDLPASFDRLIVLGATAHEEPVERGAGFVTASVVDPFGNVLGIMFNQHYLDVLTSKATA